jgi:hypothetical protein
MKDLKSKENMFSLLKSYKTSFDDRRHLLVSGHLARPYAKPVFWMRFYEKDLLPSFFLRYLNILGRQEYQNPQYCGDAQRIKAASIPYTKTSYPLNFPNGGERWKGTPQEAKYVERWSNTTSAWAGWSRFDIPVDRYGGVHSLLLCTSSPLGSSTCHQASQQGKTY